MEGEGVEPESVHGAPKVAFFEAGEGAPGGAQVGAVPFVGRIQGGELVGYAAYHEKSLQESERLWR